MIDRHAQSSIGRRNPGQTARPMGDLDARNKRDPISNTNIDPMSSRFPDQVALQKKDQ